MFQDVTLGSARFKAKRTKQTGEINVQTLEIDMFDCEAQTDASTASSSTQTGQAQPTTGRSKSKESATDTQEVDERRGLECLANVGGLMLREMAKNGASSSCFSGAVPFLLSKFPR
ncbi:hypothetical protein DVH05_011236 [Phytophthora capsici]|nr:hypothetical protein DVH05_011236 [Phytophthora capsici]